MYESMYIVLSMELFYIIITLLHLYELGQLNTLVSKFSTQKNLLHLKPMVQVQLYFCKVLLVCVELFETACDLTNKIHCIKS